MQFIVNGNALPNNQGVSSIGEFVKRLREESGEAQGKFADRVGIPRPYMSQLEAGKVGLPGAELRRRLASGLGVSHLSLLIAAGELTDAEVTDAGMVATPVDDDERTAELVELVRQGDWSDDHWYDATKTLVEAVVREQRGKR